MTFGDIRNKERRVFTELKTEPEPKKFHRLLNVKLKFFFFKSRTVYSSLGRGLFLFYRLDVQDEASVRWVGVGGEGIEGTSGAFRNTVPVSTMPTTKKSVPKTGRAI